MPANMIAKRDFLSGLIYSRETWIEQHGGKVKWSAADIETKIHGLEMLREIHSDYERSIEKAAQREIQNDSG